MFILRFLFVMFVFFLLVVLLSGILFFSSLRQVFRMFRGNNGYSKRSSTRDTQQGHTNHSRQNNTNQQTITDNRTHEQRDKRIFASDEGEYVDFEETAD